jgi:hypothetical protein
LRNLGTSKGYNSLILIKCKKIIAQLTFWSYSEPILTRLRINVNVGGCTKKKCPYCAEEIQDEVIVYLWVGQDLVENVENIAWSRNLSINHNERVTGNNEKVSDLERNYETTGYKPANRVSIVMIQ